MELPTLPTLSASLPAPHATMLLCEYGADLKHAKDGEFWTPHKIAVLIYQKQGFMPCKIAPLLSRCQAVMASLCESTHRALKCIACCSWLEMVVGVLDLIAGGSKPASCGHSWHLLRAMLASSACQQGIARLTHTAGTLSAPPLTGQGSSLRTCCHLPCLLLLICGAAAMALKLSVASAPCWAWDCRFCITCKTGTHAPSRGTSDPLCATHISVHSQSRIYSHDNDSQAGPAALKLELS